MWNPRNIEKFEDDDESWEVKAFEQDTKHNIFGTTWPPRSYTCNFCHREFRSAQALGGHMNVHRRDRASYKAHQGPIATARSRDGTLINSCVPTLPTTTVIIQSPANNIDCLSHFYQLQNPSGIFGNSSNMMNLYGTTPFPLSIVSPQLIEYSTKEMTGTLVDELDLELRLGHNPP